MIESQARHVDKPWGFETVWAEGSGYTAKTLCLMAGQRLSLQVHTEKWETLCLVSGQAMLTLDGVNVLMVKGSGYTVRPGTQHRISAVTGCIIVEASTPETGRTIRYEDDYGRGDETAEEAICES